jgi:hypothetical protein
MPIVSTNRVGAALVEENKQDVRRRALLLRFADHRSSDTGQECSALHTAAIIAKPSRMTCRRVERR